MNDKSVIDQHLDCRGLRCPLPLLRAKQALQPLPAGALLEVLADDAGSGRDIPAWLARSEHRLELAEERDGIFRFLLRRGPLPG